jgi:cytochrome c-type biogenesis protein
LATVDRAGPVARPIVTGVAFGAAWTPCVGPLLGASLVVAARDDAWHGATLLAAYSLGVGLPFLAAALALASWPVHAARLRRVGRWMEPIAGGLLVVLGVALAAGWYTQLVSPLVPS